VDVNSPPGDSAPGGSSAGDEDRFRRLYRANVESLLAYALRRVGQPEDAADVVAETFLVAWRRSRDLPADDEVRLWLYGVARRVLANHHRGGVRRERLGDRLRQRLRVAVAPDPGTEVPERLTVRAALARLGDLDREVLALTFWEGLEPREAAVVLGVSAAAVRTRLTRARSRLRDLIGHDVDPPGHVLDAMTAQTPEEGR
jgi:RNA polymerase sigma-70 factor (ECF subfamily)